MDKLATMGTIGSSFRPWLSCQGICLLNRHQTGDTDSVQPIILLPVQRDSQETFIPCEARMLWYSADRTSSQQLRDTTGFPGPGQWREVFNSDVYDNWVNPIVAGNGGQVFANGPAAQGLPFSASVVIPANGLLVFAR
jgi:hypothetical protein